MRANLGWLLFGLSLTTLSHASPPAIVIPGNGSEYDPHAKRYASIEERLDRIEKIAKATYAKVGGEAPKPGADRRAAREQYMLRACAGCHTPARVESGTDAGVLIFNDDESKTLSRAISAEQWAAIKDQVQTGKMPKKPRPPASGDERKLFD